MFENCDDCKRNSNKDRDDININNSAHCSPDPVDIPPYAFPKNKTRLEETLENLKKAKFDVMEAKKEEELMCYIVVLESLVDALTPVYFPKRDFLKMRKVLCPNWVDQIDRIDKITEPKK